ncbi:hypothetical protein CKO12_14140, partial [Chromatium okenii]|nr:hypothetical protein [Chromatium okenii]
MLTFNENVTAVTGKNLVIYKTSDNSVVATIAADDPQITIVGGVVTVNPTADLDPSTEYYVLIDNGAFEDAANNVYAGLTDKTALSFTTADPADVTAPTLDNTNPLDNATAVAVGANVVLTFSEDVTAVTGKNLVIHKTSDDSVVATIAADDAQIAIVGGVVTVNPTADLDPSTEYYVLIDNGAFEDAANNVYTGISSTTALSFTTAAADTTAPTLTSNVPADNATAVAVDGNIVLTFSEAVAAGTGNIVISDGAGDTRTIAVGDAQVTISGTTVTINPTVDLNSDTTYSVQMVSGVLTDTATNPFAGINDATTLNFSTPDTTAPTATVVLTDSALSAGETTTVTVTFSEAPTGFDAAADLTVENGTLAAGTFDATGLIYTATFTPTANITDATNVVTLGTGWTDVATNAPAADTDSLNYAVDTTAPTATVVLADSALSAGETTTVTVTFSEVPTDFVEADDLTVANGTLSGGTFD